MAYQPPYGPPQQPPYGQNPYPPQQYGQPAPYAPQQPYQQPPTRYVTKSRKDTSHGLHLVLTICTFGMWGLCVWLPITIWHKVGPRKKAVTYTR